MEEDFRARLKPFGKLYAEMEQGIRSLMEEMTNEQIGQLLDDTEQLSQSNCWWAIYDVASEVRRVGRSILQARSIEKGGEEA